MAGRPRKDPSGAPLAKLHLSPTQRADQVIRAGAARRNMSVVDYVCALVAADTGECLPGVPALQEVFDLRITA